METKICKVCGTELPISEFRKTPMAPGRVNTCKKCSERRRIESRERNKSENSIGGGSNGELARLTARELIEELRARGYKGKLYFTKEITI